MHRQMGRSHLDSLAVCAGRGAEVHSDVGLGSGAIHITGLIRRLFVRLATLVPQQFDRQVFEVFVQHRLEYPPTFDTLYYDRRSAWPRLPRKRPRYSGRNLPHKTCRTKKTKLSYAIPQQSILKFYHDAPLKANFQHCPGRSL